MDRKKKPENNNPYIETHKQDITHPLTATRVYPPLAGKDMFELPALKAMSMHILVRAGPRVGRNSNRKGLNDEVVVLGDVRDGHDR